MNFAEESEFDALIVGGGIIGLTLARELRRKGLRQVAILEKNVDCGAEASSAAAGMLAPQAEQTRADDFFHFCRQSRDFYPQFAAEIFEETGIDIELDKTGTLYLAFSDEDLDELKLRFEWQQAAGLPIEKLDEWQIAALEPNLSKLVRGGLRFPFDWQVENLKIIAALAQNARVLKTAARRLIFRKDKVAGVETDNGDYFAATVVLAAGAWTSLLDLPEKVAEAAKISPVRGQILSFGGGENLFRHVVYTPRGYIVPRRDGRVLAGATVEDAGFDNRATGAGVFSLLETAFEISPQFRRLTIQTIRSGLRPKTADNLPILGEFPPDSGLYFAAGHYRNGILLAPLTAKIVAEKIVGETSSPFLEIFNPRRFCRAAAR
jgi:glycine oxidase